MVFKMESGDVDVLARKFVPKSSVQKLSKIFGIVQGARHKSTLHRSLSSTWGYFIIILLLREEAAPLGGGLLNR